MKDCEMEGNEHNGMPHDAADPVTRNVLQRLRNVEGQVKGTQRMVSEDKYCIDILTQISAVRSALNSVGMKILRRHIETCVAAAIRSGEEAKYEMIDELMAVLERQQL